jgi:hypothetical protein
MAAFFVNWGDKLIPEAIVKLTVLGFDGTEIV